MLLKSKPRLSRKHPIYTLLLLFLLLMLPSTAVANETGVTWNHFLRCPADVNSDGYVDRRDMRMFRRAMAARRIAPRALRRFDLNRDGQIDRRDIRIARVLAGKCRTSADLNNDGVVGVPDLLMLLSAWGEDNSDLSLSNNGVISEEDLLLLLDAWGPLHVFHPCIADVNGDGRINRRDVRMVRSLVGTTDPIADVNRDGIVDRRDVVLVRNMIGARVRCRSRVRNRIMNRFAQAAQQQTSADALLELGIKMP